MWFQRIDGRDGSGVMRVPARLRPPTLSRGNAPTLEQGEPASPANGTETTPAERQNVLAACG
jgi:hypothetical protein